MHVPVATPARFDVVQAIRCCFAPTHLLLRTVPFQTMSEVGFVCVNRMARLCLSKCSVPLLKLHRLWVRLHVGAVPCKCTTMRCVHGAAGV